MKPLLNLCEEAPPKEFPLAIRKSSFLPRPATDNNLIGGSLVTTRLTPWISSIQIPLLPPFFHARLPLFSIYDKARPPAYLLIMPVIKDYITDIDEKVSKSTFGRVFRLDGSGHVS